MNEGWWLQRVDESMISSHVTQFPRSVANKGLCTYWVSRLSSPENNLFDQETFCFIISRERAAQPVAQEAENRNAEGLCYR